MKKSVSQRDTDQWGNISLTGKTDVPWITTNEKGVFYHTGMTEYTIWHLKCDCGHEWEIDEADFPGKQKLRSCGRKECTVGADVPVKRLGRPHVQERGVIMSIYVPVNVREELVAMAITKNTGTGKILTAAFNIAKEQLDAQKF